MKDDMYLRIKQVTARTGLSRATIYGMMVIGTFPMKTALGVRAVGWLASEIERWMLERKTVEKVGAEMRPGGKRKVARAVVTQSRVEAARAKVQSQTPQKVVPTLTGKFADWEDDLPPSSVAEMEAIRFKLQTSNRKNDNENEPVIRSSKPLVVPARRHELASLRHGSITLKSVKRK